MYAFVLAAVFRYVVDQPFGFFPAEARVGDGLAVDAFAYLLGAVLDVTFHHEAFYQGADVRVVFAAGKHFLDYPLLLKGVFAGIGVVAVDDGGGVFEVLCLVHLAKQDDILVVVVGVGLPGFVHVAAQDGVRVRVAGGMHFPSAVEEGVRVLRRRDGIQHHGEVAARGVLHAHGHANSAGDQAVLLVFHRAGAHSHVAENVVQVTVVFRVEHLVRAGEARFADGADVQFAYGDEPLHHVGLAVGVGLVKHPFVPVARGARLVGINARHDQDFVFDFFLHFYKAGDVIHHAVLAVGGAGPDDQKQAVVLA